MIKYKTGGWGDHLIEKVEVVKETEKTIWTQDEWWGKTKVSAHRKNSGYDNYFDSFKEAQEYLIGQAKSKIESYQGSLGREQKRLEKIKSLTEDTCPNS